MLRSVSAIVSVVLLGVFVTGCGGPGSASDSPDLSVGLVAYYPFNGNANDASGNGNNPTDPADVNATPTSDRFGNPNSAYEFDGSSSEIIVPSSESLESSTTDGTIAAWIRLAGRSSEGDGFAPILIKSGTRPPFMYQYLVTGFVDEDRDGDLSDETYAETLSLQFNTYFANDARGFTVASFESFDMGVWYHVAVAWGGGRARHYVDGVLINDEPISGNEDAAEPDDSPLYIGSDRPGVAEYFNGRIDEVRIYNRALSAAEIQLLYESD